MKTLITTFAIAMMVFAFNVAPVQAGDQEKCMWGDKAACKRHLEKSTGQKVAEIDELRDPDQADNERDVADSGNEGSTSAASAEGQ